MTPEPKRKSKPSAWMRVRPMILALLSSAFAWYAALFLCAAVLVAVGTAMEFGPGYGLLVFGLFCLAASEVIRRGMARV